MSDYPTREQAERAWSSLVLTQCPIHYLTESFGVVERIVEAYAEGRLTGGQDIADVWNDSGLEDNKAYARGQVQTWWPELADLLDAFTEEESWATRWLQQRRNA